MSLSLVANLLAAGLSALLALGVLVRGWNQLVRRLFSLGLFAFAIESALSAICIRAGSNIDFVGWQSWRLVALAAALPPWLLFSLLYSRGDGLELWKRWRWPSSAASLVLICAALWYREDMVVSMRPSEFGFLPLLGLGWPAIALHSLQLATCAAILINLERTFRASVGTLRWRIKFMTMALTVLFSVRLATSTYAILFGTFNGRLESLNAVALLIALVLMLRSLAREGQFDLELYPSQSVIRNSVTLLLVGGYLAVAGIAAKFVSSAHIEFNLPKAGSVLLLALVLLLIALMSDRLRLLIARVASRNFQRPLYDYRSIWRHFTEATSSPSSLESLCRRLVHLIAEVFNAQSVSLWTYDDQGKCFHLHASTAQSGTKTGSSQPTQEESTELQRFFASQHEPPNFERVMEPWAEILKRCHPAEFKNGGNRCCAPLLFRGECMGLLIVGDRVGGLDFGIQDIDMLKCAAEHSTASILNVRLSRQLLQSRQFEAFQTMATFFVHDLKNAASTLNLMLPNLTVHWDTPGFKEDALRGISKTVTHINQLVSRLGKLRGELSLSPVQTDLSLVTRDTLKAIKIKPGIELQTQLETPALGMLDAEQITKVVTNLVLNASEAMSEDKGRIELSTFTEANWIGLRVQDSGCGMSQDFIDKSLFRPFQTTKKEGLGIGMFHSRMIIDAHGGRVKVESQKGAGTTFTLLFPKLGATTKT